MTYSEAISTLFTEQSAMPNSYVRKQTFYNNISILNTEDPGQSTTLQNALNVCNDIYWDYPTTNFANALDEIAKTVNPDARPYPKVRL